MNTERGSHCGHLQGFALAARIALKQNATGFGPSASKIDLSGNQETKTQTQLQVPQPGAIRTSPSGFTVLSLSLHGSGRAF